MCSTLNRVMTGVCYIFSPFVLVAVEKGAKLAVSYSLERVVNTPVTRFFQNDQKAAKRRNLFFPQQKLSLHIRWLYYYNPIDFAPMILIKWQAFNLYHQQGLWISIKVSFNYFKNNSCFEFITHWFLTERQHLRSIRIAISTQNLVKDYLCASSVVKDCRLNADPC